MKLVLFLTATLSLGFSAATSLCPTGLDPKPDNTYKDESTGSTRVCGDVFDYCKANLDECGDRDALASFFAGVGCCKRKADKKFCVGGSSRECQDVQANGLTFECSTAGKQSAGSMDVLMLHGFPEYTRYWDSLLAYWESSSANIYAVSCNLRGYSPGASPTDVKEYEWDELVKDAFAIADAFKFTSFHVVSHDMGAGLAWTMGSRKDLKHRLLSLTTLSVPHGDALNKAIVESEEQMVASNYFNQLSMIDSAERLKAIFYGTIPQTTLWWYYTSVGKGSTRPAVPTDAVFKKYPQYGFVHEVRAAFPIAPRPAVLATTPEGTIYAPTFLVCGAKDPYLKCNNAYAKSSGDYVASAYEYKHGSFECDHDLFEGCTDADEAKRVMVAITDWIKEKHVTYAYEHVAPPSCPLGYWASGCGQAASKQTGSVVCMSKRGVKVDDSKCAGKKKPEPMTKTCPKTPPCPRCKGCKRDGDCLKACGDNAGLCSACDSADGTPGACCSAGKADGPIECQMAEPQLFAAVKDKHTCALMPGDAHVASLIKDAFKRLDELEDDVNSLRGSRKD